MFVQAVFIYVHNIVTMRLYILTCLIGSLCRPFYRYMVKTATSQNGDRSKRRHRNGDRNGYSQKVNKHKQHLQF